MKLSFIFAGLTLICIVHSARLSSSSRRSLIIPDYSNEDESEENTETKSTRPVSTTPTRNRFVYSTRTSWMMQPISSMKTTTNSDDETVDLNDSESYLTNIRKFLKKTLEDLRKLLKTITGYDVVHAVQNLFKKKSND
ncbi:unnamed protein product [Rotaria magnacalcarata]|nr:unnamed protein product [Rotaria magnacalcarata]CAF3814261.1 unnamed protein product [Rotaria magnacalcarata]CAF5102907.1 unnamed protein product [Rotaria magnacalcarata]CAF5192467.1 unnamed protein product [Rotaria magnacalcarata]